VVGVFWRYIDLSTKPAGYARLLFIQFWASGEQSSQECKIPCPGCR